MDLLLRHIRWYAQGRLHAGDLRVRRGRVCETGRGLAPRRREQVLAGDGYLALPGLINAHDHLGFNLFPHLGTPPYPDFYAWARDIYHPHRAPVRDVLRVPPADRLLWGAYKQLISGVTTVVHHNPYARRLFGRGFPVKVLRRYGWAHSLGHGPDVARAFAHSADRPFVIHAAEGTGPAAAAEIDALDRLGVLTPRTILVHAVAVTPAQGERLAALRAGVVWCPSSNLHLFGQTAPIDRLPPGVRVALGTDSTLSGAPTLWDELRAAHATGLTTSDDLLAMVTTRAADLFLLRDGRGTVKPGAPADLLLLPDTGLPAAETLLAAVPSDLALVLVDGTPRLASPTVADHLGLGPPNARIDGEARWLAGAFGAVRSRIARLVDGAILSRNPLWTRLGHISSPAASCHDHPLQSLEHPVA